MTFIAQDQNSQGARAFTPTLSPRLQTIAAYVPQASQLADVGTDHALLPIHLLRAGRIASAVASDVAPGPALAALRNVGAAQCSAWISVRQGDGLQTVSPGEVNVVVIAGLGGSVMARILDARPAVCATLDKVILQPMSGAAAARLALCVHGFWVKDEKVVADGGRLYEIVVADRALLPRRERIDPPQHAVRTDPAYARYGDDPIGLALALEFGPLLLRDRAAATVQQVARALDRWQTCAAGMSRSARASTRARRDQLQRKVARLEAWLRNRWPADDRA